MPNLPLKRNHSPLMFLRFLLASNELSMITPLNSGSTTNCSSSRWRLLFSAFLIFAIFFGLSTGIPGSGSELNQSYAAEFTLESNASWTSQDDSKKSPPEGTEQKKSAATNGDNQPQENKSGTADSSKIESGQNRDAAENQTTAESDSNGAATAGSAELDIYPLIVLGIGIVTVLVLIIVFRINAFIALITAAIVVSLLSPGAIESKISRVASAFGSSAGGIAIVIALAAVIGKCMLDSGAADRIVRSFLSLLGEKKSPIALNASGFILAVPVFFDTVFYLLVPLARSLHRKTGSKYLLYILAISAGGAIAHTLVPPTPGPLLMAETLGVQVGTMILIGALVGIPASIAGLIFSSILDRLMPIPMREISGVTEPEPLDDEELPSLWISLSPIVLPVLLIAGSTVATTIANAEYAARFKSGDINWSQFQADFASQYNTADRDTVAKRIANHPSMSELEEVDLLVDGSQLSDENKANLIAGFNNLIRDKKFFSEDAFLGIKINDVAKAKLGSNLQRINLANKERMNRALLESAYPAISAHNWDTSKRKVSNFFGLLGNANLALLISTIIALVTLVRQRGLTLTAMGTVVEEALSSGGVIILITAAGGAFGAMLTVAEIGPAIQKLFSSSGDGFQSYQGYLFLGFLIAAVLKVAQGSSTVAMIVGSSMMAAIVSGTEMGCHPVYLATSIGAGSLIGSWMNDSGFWIFAKMGGLTEVEALKSWTLLLAVMGLTSFGVSLLLAYLMPLV